MEVNKLTSEQLVAHYMMHSYLYYIEGTSVISDRSYDLLCQRLLAEWDDLHHPHKVLIDKQALSSGTGFYLKEEDYPSIAKITAREMVLEQRGDTKWTL
jgi:NAD-dependent DNA ligase